MNYFISAVILINRIELDYRIKYSSVRGKTIIRNLCIRRKFVENIKIRWK